MVTAGVPVALLLGLVAYPITRTLILEKNQNQTSSVVPELTPWKSVGGCGAGGSGGGGGGAKWIGMGVSGGLIDVQVLASTTIGQNYRQHSVSTRLSTKPTYTTTLGLSVPVVSKMGNHQPQSNFEDKTEITGGLGDLAVDWSKSFGMSGQYSLAFALSMPTGQYDIKRGKDNEKEYLSTSLQKGSGLWSPSVTLSYSKDVIDGMWMFDVGYSHPVAINFHGKNQLIKKEPDQFKHLAEEWDDMPVDQRERFEYVFKPYGENDLGGYTPPSMNLAAYYAYRGHDHFVHSWGMTFSTPFGVTWIPNFTAAKYDPFPDPDHKAWTATLNYGIEFSRHEFPLFLAVSLPINDQSNDPNPKDKYDPEPFKEWDPPDWGDLMQSWTVAVGIKSTMF
jgi:hypothetical protein